MTIEERLEDNARTVQFILTLQKSHDDQIAALIERDAALFAKMDILTDKMNILTDRTMQAMDAINRLGHIAASHDERLDDLEGRNQP
jgi:K+/H+ antiporter YhaU regulatory subunit KhtT